VARAAGLVERVEQSVVRLQREAFVAGAQLATAAENQARLTEGVSRVTPEMTELAEAEIDALVDEHPLPQEFVLPGQSPGAAGLDLARAIARRAERRVVQMQRAGLSVDPEVMHYLNRVSDLLFALARFEEAERGVRAPPSRAR
jgi:cob(I)alamin adenosyltransferase